MLRRTRVAGTALLVALAATLAATLGCGLSTSGGKSGGPAVNTYLYVEAGTIAQFQVQSDGTLTPLSPATVGTPSFEGGAFAAVDPSNHYLVASSSNNSGNYALNQYVIGADGTLTPNTIPTVNTDELSKFAFTPDGKFAIVPDFISPNCSDCWAGTLETYSLSSSGTLALASQTTLEPASGSPGNAVAFDPSGKFVYMLCSFENFYYSIYEYSISPNGTLAPLSPNFVIAPSSAYNFTAAPNGFLYTVNGPGTITAFWIDESTGQVANAGSFPSGTDGEGNPHSIAFSPTGTYAYAANSSDNSVTQFTVNASTGALTMNGPDVPTGQSPCQVAMDPSGKFVFVTNSFDGTISQFTVGTGGRLTPNGTFSLGVNSYPTVMTFAQR
jgi:6-phosphogluconolactonase